MQTSSQVKDQIKKLKISGLFSIRNEISYLHKVLSDDEEILGISSGIVDNSKWCIVITNNRIILLDKGMFWGIKQRETSISKINTIQSSTGIMGGKIEITDGSSKIVEMKYINNSAVFPLVEALKKAMNDNKHIVKSEIIKTKDFTLMLEKLAVLREKGILTEEEFQEEKRKILSK